MGTLEYRSVILEKSVNGKSNTRSVTAIAGSATPPAMAPELDIRRAGDDIAHPSYHQPMTDTTPDLTIPGPTCYPHPMPDDPDQLARDRARLAELQARWSPSISDLRHDDAMRWYRTGMEIRQLQRRIEAAEKEEGKR